MNIIKAKDAAIASKNINRCDWVDGAAKLVTANEVQYDRSTEWRNEPLICREKILVNDVMEKGDFEDIINKWLDGAECCDCRDELNELIFDKACEQLKFMADDFEIGVI